MDLEDTKLEQLRLEYEQRRSLLMSCSALSTRDDLEACIRSLIADLEKDALFLADGLIKAAADYQKRSDSPSSSKEVLMTLCWERVEYNTLLQHSQASKATFEDLLTHLPPVCLRV